MKFGQSSFKLIDLALSVFFCSISVTVNLATERNEENLNLSPEQWRTDLKFLAEGIERNHKNAFHFVSKQNFRRAVVDLDRRIPNLKSHEIVLGFQKLAAMIGDGHTFVATWGIQRFYPLDLYWFNDELRVVRADAKYEKALGKRLVAIDGLPLSEVRRRLQTVVPQGENQWFELHQTSGQIVRAELLNALKITNSAGFAVFTFADEAGKIFKLRIDSLSPDSTVEWTNFLKNPPLYLQNTDQGFWFKYLPEKQLIYLCFRNYRDLQENVEKLLTFIDEHKPQNLIIDLRQNGGGNFSLLRQFLIYQLAIRRRINRKNHLFVITGRATFSAAMTNAMDFRRETDALLIGEPPGARPTGYQENYWFELPNSHLRVSVSMLFYKFTDRDIPAILPDIFVAPNWNDYKRGHDSVMDKVMSII